MKYIKEIVRGTDELYPLADDPTEQRSLAGDYPDVVQEGRRLLEQGARSIEHFTTTDPTAKEGQNRENEELLRRLRSLGYIQ